jgi:hypothetical protein
MLALFLSMELNAETIYIEGENPAENNFIPGISVFGTPPDPLATSGGKALLLWTQNLEDVRKASYQFQVTEEGEYYVWVAATDPTHPATSPYQWVVDGGAPEKAVAETQTAEYGAENDKPFAWRLLGKRKLESGAHTLEFLVSDGARNNNSGYMVMYLDAFLLTTESSLKPKGSAMAEILK